MVCFLSLSLFSVFSFFESSHYVATQTGNPLYVLPWDPTSIGAGLHTLVVVAFDTVGSQKSTIQFSVDKTPAEIPRNQATVMQHFPVHAVVQVAFSVLYLYSFGVILVGSRIWAWRTNRSVESEDVFTPLLKGVYSSFILILNIQDFNCDHQQKKQQQSPRVETVWSGVKAEMTEKLLAYSSLSRLNWAIMLFFWLNLILGPLVVGPIVDQEHYGAVFVWGAAANMTYNFTVEALIAAFIMLLALYLPVLHVLISLDFGTKRRGPVVTCGLVFYIIIFLIASGALLFLLILFETWTGLLITPAITWFIVIALVLIVRGFVLHRKHIEVEVYDQIQL